MSEIFLGTIPFIQVIIFSVACYLYMLGGRKDKWIRRFVGSLVIFFSLAIGAYLLDVFKWQLLLTYPITAFQFHRGYGASELSIKILKRSIVVLCGLVNGILLAWAYNNWDVLPIHVAGGMISVYLG